MHLFKHNNQIDIREITHSMKPELYDITLFDWPFNGHDPINKQCTICTIENH